MVSRLALFRPKHAADMAAPPSGRMVSYSPMSRIQCLGVHGSRHRGIASQHRIWSMCILIDRAGVVVIDRDDYRE